MLPDTEAEQSLPLPRRSQVVHERISITTTPRRRTVISMERESTGGSRYAAQFYRSTDGPMSGAERAKKKRVRASLFPQACATARNKDRGRKRDAKERAAVDSDAAQDCECADMFMTPTTAKAALHKYRTKVVQSCVDWMVAAVERAIAEDSVDRLASTVQMQHVYRRGTWMFV